MFILKNKAKQKYHSYFPNILSRSAWKTANRNSSPSTDRNRTTRNPTTAEIARGTTTPTMAPDLPPVATPGGAATSRINRVRGPARPSKAAITGVRKTPTTYRITATPTPINSSTATPSKGTATPSKGLPPYLYLCNRYRIRWPPCITCPARLRSTRSLKTRRTWPCSACSRPCR